jgi:hypothetical protein
MCRETAFLIRCSPIDPTSCALGGAGVDLAATILSSTLARKAAIRAARPGGSVCSCGLASLRLAASSGGGQVSVEPAPGSTAIRDANSASTRAASEPVSVFFATSERCAHAVAPSGSVTSSSSFKSRVRKAADFFGID